MSAPVCGCHAVVMQWHKDPRSRLGGYWRCRVAQRERDRLRAAHPNRRASKLRYWHKHEGGYIRRRRRELAAERADIQAQLRQLDMEAHAC